MACKSLDHIKKAADRAVSAYESHRTTADQAVMDIAVVVMSFMTKEEIETCMYMSVGAEGVADLVASTLNRQAKAVTHLLPDPPPT